MIAPASLAGKTLVVTGASRGIGKAIALSAARDGANVAVLAKTAQQHPRLPGTVFSACDEIERAGGKALPCVVDIRDAEQIQRAVEATVERFGGIDVLVNNASAISLTPTPNTPLKRFDLMHQINTRGTFACTQACYPHLARAANPHVLTLAPPLNLRPEYFAPHVAYSVAKFGMSLLTLGFAKEFEAAGIAANCLWPKTIIATAAIENLFGGGDTLKHARKPEIVAAAAHAIVSKASRSFTGQFCIDEDLLRAEGETDFEQYAVEPGTSLAPDLFV